MSGANLTAEDYIDYIYDDNLDYFTNVDYTLPESWAYLDAKLPHEPQTQSPIWVQLPSLNVIEPMV